MRLSGNRAFTLLKKETIMELMVPIENKDDTPLYEQIYTYIKGEIRRKASRRSRLPSTRILAGNLHVSRSTTSWLMNSCCLRVYRGTSL